MESLQKLNKEQQEAVCHYEGPLLILAGAGSGKTRVLTNRIAWLISEKQVDPWNILAITFTNKAAGEMKSRVEKQLGDEGRGVWTATFHSTCCRILRRFADRIGYDPHFDIYDTEDQKSVIKSVMKALKADPAVYKERTIMGLLSSAKDELIGPDEYEKNSAGNPAALTTARIYREYQSQLKKNNALDFDDLLFKTVELFRKCPDVLEYYQDRFRFIMVDEYQDTNTAQFEFVHLLSARYKNLCVVGDDDQSIYGFRGASPGVLRNFLEDYPDAAVIRLSVNYRCSGPIVRAAGLVIQQNRDRFPKKITAFRGEGEPVKSLCCTDEAEEYGVILERLKRIPEEELKNTAVIFRNHFQAGNFTDFLKFHGFPVTEPGEKPAPEALAVRDVVLSYLRAASGMEGSALGECTRADFYRIMNCPMRYFVRASAGSERVSIDSLCTYYRSNPPMLETIRLLERDFRLLLHLGPPLAVRYIRKTLRAEEGLLEGTSEKVRERIHRAFDALEQKASGFRTQEDFIRFLSGNEDIGKTTPAEDGDSTDSHSVQVLTMHASKGLEFGSVFLPDLNEGILPGRQSITPASVEEERRLFYVAMTRAKNSLYLSYTCGTKANPRRPSRFLRPLGIKD